VLGFSKFRAIRVKRVQLWAPTLNLGSATEIAITPNASDSGQNSFVDLPITMQDSTISIDRPAYIDWHPSSESPSGSWHLSTSTALSLFTTDTDLGAVLDITFEYVENLQTDPLGYTVPLVGATVGKQYCRAIQNFVPVNINTI